jgi:hypothetical protein
VCSKIAEILYLLLKFNFLYICCTLAQLLTKSNMTIFRRVSCIQNDNQILVFPNSADTGLIAGWPDEFEKKSPQMKPNPFRFQNHCITFTTGKEVQNFRPLIDVTVIKLPKVNNHPMSENSPNLVTLVTSFKWTCKFRFNFLYSKNITSKPYFTFKEENSF